MLVRAKDGFGRPLALGEERMISLTRLNGERIAVNPDLIERAEETPDTVLTLTNGTRYVVTESIEELAEKIQCFRAGTLAIARELAEDPEATANFRLHLVRGADPSSDHPSGQVRDSGPGLDEPDDTHDDDHPRRFVR
jgi:flagellar protein FlbD